VRGKEGAAWNHAGGAETDFVVGQDFAAKMEDMFADRRPGAIDKFCEHKQMRGF
jgi:hypothetical protein